VLPNITEIIELNDTHPDPDFMESTRTLLADVSAARGHPVPVSNASTSSSGDATTTEPAHVYPFNIILSSATIPYSLDAHLNQHHPNMTRLVSPRLHRLPSSLKTEHVSYGQGGGNRLVDVERRLKAAWMTDGYEGREQGRVLIFVNKGTKVEEIKHGLESKGIKCIGLSGGSDTRSFGSNKHLQGFLKAMPGKEQQIQNKTIPNNDTNTNTANTGNDRAVPPRNEEEPRVLITTSLLSRGLDFSPDVRHVFILDNPRNMVDFLHRAGRSARAGKEGTVVLFGKTKGRGSKEGKDVRKKIGEYKA
jgi:ATP-dependent RNA helicase MRH4